MRCHCSVRCTAGMLISSKSPLCDYFRASRTNRYCGDWVLHVALPLTSCDFCSQILCVYERSIGVFFFFEGFFFLLRMRGNLLIYRKMSISRLLWGDRWKLHGEIQRHAIVTTYMFMTNDRCEDSFV